MPIEKQCKNLLFIFPPKSFKYKTFAMLVNLALKNKYGRDY